MSHVRIVPGASHTQAVSGDSGRLDWAGWERKWERTETATAPVLDLTFGQTVVIGVLSGGVAGGLVSGVISLFGDSLTRRHERNSRARGERKAIYLRLLRFLSVNLAGIDKFLQEGRRPAGSWSRKETCAT